MAFAFPPMLRFYRRPLVGGVALPAIAAAYTPSPSDPRCNIGAGAAATGRAAIQAPTREAGRA